ncbi:hypothetical protein Pan3_57 [Pseudanabaena phage Pan3]|nr:hypothetical protein Pan3_57 [Pseudanabaena phage Pan3]
MSYADLIRNMAAAGAPIDAIVMAVEAIEARDNEAAAQRAKAAERKRRQRERERDDSVTVTGQSQDADGTDPLSPAPFLPPHTPPTNPHPHTPEDINTRTRKGPDFPRPDWCEPAVWADLLRNRKAKKLTNTATAHAKLMRDVAAMATETGDALPVVLQRCVERGWGAIYDYRDKTDGRKPQAAAETKAMTDAERRAVFDRRCDKARQGDAEALEHARACAKAWGFEMPDIAPAATVQVPAFMVPDKRARA